jgi:phage tail tape-measure protein
LRLIGLIDSGSSFTYLKKLNGYAARPSAGAGGGWHFTCFAFVGAHNFGAHDMAAAKQPRDTSAETKKGTKKAKMVDLPPHGDRNPDPITNAAGAHPIETGVGAALAGAAAGALAGALGGPLGAVAGAIAGGAAVGGVAGHAAGEMIDPTFEDKWISDYRNSQANPPTQAELETLRRAFRFGMASQADYSSTDFREVESDLRRSWESREYESWEKVRDAVRVGFDRTSYSPNPMR